MLVIPGPAGQAMPAWYRPEVVVQATCPDPVVWASEHCELPAGQSRTPGCSLDYSPVGDVTETVSEIVTCSLHELERRYDTSKYRREVEEQG